MIFIMTEKESAGNEVRVLFSEGLAYFLPGRGRGRALNHDLRRRASVKDIVQSFGVPHTEVGQICFNGAAVDFSFIPERSGSLDVRGIVSPFEVVKSSRLRPRCLNLIRFIADLNVMKLGRYLLLLGFDVELARDMPDKGIAEAAEKQGRIVLTRDTRLLFRSKISFARRIRASLTMAQLVETLEFFGLRPDPAQFFTRCVRCNRALERVEKERVYHLLEPKTRKYFTRFLRCPGCRQVFWKGSHYDRILDRFKDLGILS